MVPHGNGSLNLASNCFEYLLNHVNTWSMYIFISADELSVIFPRIKGIFVQVMAAMDFQLFQTYVIKILFSDDSRVGTIYILQFKIAAICTSCLCSKY